MNSARFLVCESTGRWAAAFRLEIGEWRVYEIRGLPDLFAELGLSAYSAVALEMTPANAEAVLAAIVRVREQFPKAIVVVMLPPSSRPYECLAREAGAMHVATSPRELHHAVALVRRHLTAAPPPRESLAEAMWNQLPWSESIPSNPVE